MAATDDDVYDPFASIHEPFSGLNERDFDLHGIFMDYEPEDEFLSTLDKCKDYFLNVLLSDQNLRDASMSDELRAQIYHGNDWRSDEEDEEVPKTKYRIHDPHVRWDKMDPKVGDMFESPAQLKFCVANYAVANGYQIYFEKSDNQRVVARCGKRKENNLCPFRLHAAWMYEERSFQIKSLVEKHKCSRTFKFGSIVSPEWIGRHYMTEIATKPKIKLREMIAEIKQKFRCQVSMGQCRRAKKWARELIEGKLSEHYSRIWDYSHEMLRSNPGSTCKVSVTTNPDGQNYFHRFYICFKALSGGWKRGCRRVIGLDGCFLKGEVKGELLTAIGRDSNNQVFPIAWAVVDIENKPNWTWFLELLKDDLELEDGRGLVVISDQHKGLLESVKDILPNVEHRNCARHIYANFRKGWSGLEFKKLFWAASMSCIEGDFNRHMESIKKLSPDAYAYLMSKEPKTWCRAYFSGGYACEAVENGMSECFNAIILDARKKPLITMLEEIRIYIMDRIAHMSEKCAKWENNVCPAILKKMDKFGKYMRFWMVLHSHDNVFETRNMCESYMVDLDGKCCSCRLWDLAGIPCVHAQAAINYKNETADKYCNAFFSKDKFLQCYTTNIRPVNGSNLWPVTEFTKPLPPVGRKMPGRPATKRRRHPSETDSKFSSNRVNAPRTVQCSNCLEHGHNKKSCPNETRPRVPTEPKKTGRPKKDRADIGPKRASRKRQAAPTNNSQSGPTAPTQAPHIPPTNNTQTTPTAPIPPTNTTQTTPTAPTNNSQTAPTNNSQTPPTDNTQTGSKVKKSAKQPSSSRGGIKRNKLGIKRGGYRGGRAPGGVWVGQPGRFTMASSGSGKEKMVHAKVGQPQKGGQFVPDKNADQSTPQMNTEQDVEMNVGESDQNDVYVPQFQEGCVPQMNVGEADQNGPLNDLMLDVLGVDNGSDEAIVSQVINESVGNQLSNTLEDIEFGINAILFEDNGGGTLKLYKMTKRLKQWWNLSPKQLQHTSNCHLQPCVFAFVKTL